MSGLALRADENVNYARCQFGIARFNCQSAKHRPSLPSVYRTSSLLSACICGKNPKITAAFSHPPHPRFVIRAIRSTSLGVSCFMLQRVQAKLVILAM
jgi:hypothetical protein